MWLRRFSIATVFATFCLLISGGFVSVMEAGMACGFDWPLCQGEFIPRMIDGKQFEHPHRLTAAFVGVMLFGMCALIVKHRRQDRVLVQFGILAVALYVMQALLGMLTVKLGLPAWVSSTHQANAMALFCVATSMAFLVRQRMPDAPEPKLSPEVRARLAKWILPVALLAYAQVVAGAVMRHTVGGLACGFDFPLCLGKIWPIHGHLGIQAHMVHRTLGFIVGIAVCVMAARVWPLAKGNRAVRTLSMGLVFAVIAQITLGILTILTSRDVLVMTIHSSLGAALLCGLVSLYWLAKPAKRFEPAAAEQPAGALGMA